MKLANFKETDSMGVRGITEEAVPFEKRIEVGQTREKADKFGVHRLQNDLREMPGVPKRSDKVQIITTDLGTMDFRLGEGV